ncbi:MAG: toll/interleukin-1 receptor domain-containing protein [Candidatus Thiothrix sulfatifontis]|nr:MAG: toll/interleukin-1 receptor domain-containing protein [Candidatus Thiothrix sulfatifontis]
MAKIFISHSSKDKAEALQIMHWLKSQGFESLFLDSDARHGIAAGSEWEKVLYREIQRSHALICLLSDHWLASQWCGFEFMQARALGKTIFPLRIQPGLQTTVAADLQHLDLTKDRDDALQRLHAQLTELTLTLQQRFDWDKTRPPYPGMLAFEAEDAPVFFGRDHETNQLRERLNQHRTLGNASVLLMLAASGAGKSSLLKAGLLPRLRRDTRHWLLLEALRPEREPLRKLAQVLATANGTPQHAAELYAQLQGEQALPALRDYLEQLRTPNAQWDATVLLSIDQAEELFTTAEPPQTQALFQLLLAAQQAKLPLLTLMAMRSDYLAALQAQVSETGALETSLFALDPLPLERVSDLIRGPAGVVGLTVEDGLVTAATRDAATADALPLLAFALRELYERFGAGGDLTLDEYQRLGSEHLNPLENAVQHKASAAIQPDRLGEAAQQALRDAFIPHLVRVNDAGDYVRQAADWEALPAAAHPLLDKLTNARLLVQRSANGIKRVEVAHEALLRHWQLLNGWLREEHDFLLGKQQLEHSLREWQHLPDTHKDKGLLQGITLERAREWLFANRSGLSADERAYIQHSHQAEEQRQQRLEAMLREANTLINFINFDLRDKLKPIGRLDIMQDIQSRVTAYYRNLGDSVQGDDLERQRAVGFGQQADTLAAQGKLPEAEKLYREASQSFQQRADKDSSNTDWQSDLSVSLEKIGNILKAQDKLDDAKAVFEKSMNIRRTLADNDPSNAEWQRYLSVSLNKIGEILTEQGKLDDAKAVFEKSQTIAQTLADNDPSNTGWQQDLSASLIWIGTILSNQGKLDKSRAVFEKSMNIRRTLADNDPSNAEWQRYLSVSLNKIGEILTEQGKLDDAKAVFEKSQTIAQTLADNDPSNAGWQTDVVILHFKLMGIAQQNGETKVVRTHLEKALAILKPLEEKGLLHGQQQQWIGIIEKTLKELE